MFNLLVTVTVSDGTVPHSVVLEFEHRRVSEAAEANLLAASGQRAIHYKVIKLY